MTKLVRITGMEAIGRSYRIPRGCIKQRSVNQDCIWVDARRKRRIQRRVRGV